MTLSSLRELLHTEDLPCYLYQAPTGVNDYIVLQVCGIDGIRGSDTIEATADRVQVDVFSQQSDYRSDFQTVLNTLAAQADLFVGFPEISWDEETRSQRMIVQLAISN